MTDPRVRGGGVIVGVDGSERGRTAVEYGAREAARLGAPLHLVMILPVTIPIAPEMLPVGSDPSLQAFGAETLRKAQTDARELCPGLEVVTHLRSGSRVHELLSCTESARLVVLGNREARATGHIWTGTTVTAVASWARCPVLVVPAGWEASSRGRILVGVGSPGETSGLWDVAFPMAAERGAEIVALHAWWLGGAFDTVVSDEGDAACWQHEQARLIDDELADYVRAFPTVVTHTFVRHEAPAQALVRASCGADLLLLRRQATGRFHRHLGQVTRAVLRDAHCPVEIVPAECRAEGASQALDTSVVAGVTQPRDEGL